MYITLDLEKLKNEGGSGSSSHKGTRCVCTPASFLLTRLSEPKCFERPGLQKKSFREIMQSVSAILYFFFLPRNALHCLCHALLSRSPAASGRYFRHSCGKRFHALDVCACGMRSAADTFFCLSNCCKNPPLLQEFHRHTKKPHIVHCALCSCIVWLENLFSCCM